VRETDWSDERRLGREHWRWQPAGQAVASLECRPGWQAGEQLRMVRQVWTDPGTLRRQPAQPDCPVWAAQPAWEAEAFQGLPAVGWRGLLVREAARLEAAPDEAARREPVATPAAVLRARPGSAPPTWERQQQESALSERREWAPPHPPA
jgi:hypothetical protein